MNISVILQTNFNSILRKEKGLIFVKNLPSDVICFVNLINSENSQVTKCTNDE